MEKLFKEAVNREEKLENPVDIAENPNTSPKILYFLAKNRSHVVRGTVAKNPKAPSKALAILAKDKVSWGIREDVAKHPNTSSDVLEELVRDKDWQVSKAAQKNPNTPW